MNAYDFDKTILSADSTEKFYFFCLKRHPKILLTIPATIFAFIKYALGLVSKTSFKEVMYRFLTCLPDAHKDIEEFWDSHINLTFDWYKKAHRDDDVVISASPEFLIKPACERLGISKVIASRVDLHTGKYTGENCWGREKVRRFHEEYGNAEVQNFYSDSLSDTPMAKISQSAYIITKGAPVDWDSFKPSFKSKLFHVIFNTEFLSFALIGCINVCDGVLFEYLLSLVILPNIAFVIGYLMSLSISYLLNGKFTFKTRLNFSGYIKFLISYIPNFVIQNLCVFVLYNTIGTHQLFAYIVAAMIGVPVTFAAVKLFAFGKTGE